MSYKKKSHITPILGTAVIDSLRIRLRTSTLSYINPKLIEKYQRYYQTTGEIAQPQYNAQPFIFSENGITTRIFLKSYRSGDVSENYLVCTVSAKFLKSNYFEGITKNNIHEVYNLLISFNQFHCDINTFLDAAVNDVDICINERLQQKDLLKLGSYIQMSLNTKHYHHFNLFNNKSQNGQNINLGIEINKRDTATPALPHIKIYHKEIELLTKSIEFYKNYLEPSYITDLVRYETNIKHTKHRKYLQKKIPSLGYKSLKELLQTPQDILKQVVYNSIPQYQGKQFKIKSDITLTPIDRLLQFYMQSLISSGWSVSDLYSYDVLFDKSKLGRKQLSRLNTKIQPLVSSVTNNTHTNKILNQNERIKNFITNKLKINI